MPMDVKNYEIREAMMLKLYTNDWNTIKKKKSENNKALVYTREKEESQMFVPQLQAFIIYLTYFGGFRSLWIRGFGFILCRYSTPLAHCNAQLIAWAAL